MKRDFNYLDTALRMYLAGTSKDDVLTFMDEQVELNNNVSVKVWREDKRIPLPKYGKEGDACCDIYCKSVEYDSDKDRYIVHTGLHFALPDEYEMELRPRSSNTKTEFYVLMHLELLIGVIVENFLSFSKDVLINILYQHLKNLKIQFVLCLVLRTIH